MQQESLFSSDSIFRSLWKFLLLNIGIVFILFIVQCPSCLFSWQGLVSRRNELIFSFLMSSALSFGGYYVNHFIEGRISWIKEPFKRFLATVITYMTYSFVVSFILISGMVLVLVEEVNIHNISWSRMLENTIMPTIIAFIVISIFISRRWLMEWRNVAIEAEKLRSEKLASQYQSLKDQLNPHFLFNSLNVLSNLVYESADRSAEFIQQLAKIYRYVLDVQQEELVDLDAELVFAENYLSLQKLRFEKNLEYFIDVQETQGYYLPPLSLQLLLENAVKHNIASKEKPLKIMIQKENDRLIIRNILQPKNSPGDEGSGIGLENIRQRYALLSKEKPEIRESSTEFIVVLPLLKVEGK